MNHSEREIYLPNIICITLSQANYYKEPGLTFIPHFSLYLDLRETLTSRGYETCVRQVLLRLLNDERNVQIYRARNSNGLFIQC